VYWPPMPAMPSCIWPPRPRAPALRRDQPVWESRSNPRRAACWPSASRVPAVRCAGPTTWWWAGALSASRSRTPTRPRSPATSTPTT